MKPSHSACEVIKFTRRESWGESSLSWFLAHQSLMYSRVTPWGQGQSVWIEVVPGTNLSIPCTFGQIPVQLDLCTPCCPCWFPCLSEALRRFPTKQIQTHPFYAPLVTFALTLCACFKMERLKSCWLRASFWQPYQAIKCNSVLLLSRMLREEFGKGWESWCCAQHPSLACPGFLQCWIVVLLSKAPFPPWEGAVHSWNCPVCEPGEKAAPSS